MNISSAQVRKRLEEFEGGFFGRKISSGALLRDTGYFITDPEDLRRRVIMARHWMAKISRVPIESLSSIMSNADGKDNGRLDCDNFAIDGCSIMKREFDADCRESGDNDSQELAIWPAARDDIDHSQALCLTTDGWRMVEFITGEIVSKIPKLLQVG